MPIIQLQIQLIKVNPFTSNFTSNPFRNFLVNVIDKAENKYIKIQIKDKSRNRKDFLAVSAVKTAKNGRSVEIRTPGLQYPKLARYQLRYTSKYSVFALRIIEMPFRVPCRAAPPPSHSRALSPRYTRLCSLPASGGFASQKQQSVVFSSLLPTALHLEVLNFMPGATRIYASCALFDTQIA